METIYYTSDLKWFGKLTTDKYKSKKEMVAHHIDYTTGKAEFVLGNREKFLNRVELADKRVNSRVAFSFVFALPNSLDTDKVKQWSKDIRERIANIFGMNEEDILIAYHNDTGISGEKNKHIHIAGLNLASNGKSLRVNQKELKKLHQELQNYIRRQGYIIRKDNENERHIGTILRWNKEMKEQYINYVKAKKEKREKENELLRRVRKATIQRNFERERSIREIENDISNLIGRNRKRRIGIGELEKRKEYDISRDTGIAGTEKRIGTGTNELKNEIGKLENEIGKIGERIARMKEKKKLNELKEKVNLAEFVINVFKYEIKIEKTSQNYIVLKKVFKNGKEDIIVINKNENTGHWQYFNANDNTDKGTIVDFLQKRTGKNIGYIRKFLENYLELKQKGKIKGFEEIIKEHNLKTSATPKKVSINQVLKEFALLKKVEDENNYLSRDRKIDFETYKDMNIYKDQKGNIVFPLVDESGTITGLARYNKGYKNIFGNKGIWLSIFSENPENIKRKMKRKNKIVITESPIDALSHKELKEDEFDKTIFISTQGQISPKTIDNIYSYIKEINTYPKEIILAFDNDEKGKEFAEKMKKELLERMKKTEKYALYDIYIERPQGKDWNEDLQKLKQEQEQEQKQEQEKKSKSIKLDIWNNDNDKGIGFDR